MPSDIVPTATQWRNFSIGLTAEQGEVIAVVSDELDLSLGGIMDDVFEAFFPKAFGLEWPRSNRESRRQNKITVGSKPLYGNYSIYGVLLTHEQQEVVREALSRFGSSYGLWSALWEAAFEEVFEEVFGVQWPRGRRYRRLDWRSINEGDR